MKVKLPDIKKMVVADDAEMKGASKEFQSRIDTVLRKLERDIADMADRYRKTRNLSAGEAVDLEFALWSRGQLQRSLTDAGFYTEVGGISKSYKSVLDSVAKRYKMFDHSMKLSEVDARVVKDLAQFSIDGMYGYAQQTLDQVYQSIYLNVLSPTPFSEVMKAVATTLEGSPLAKYTYTYVNNGLMQFYRGVGDRAAQSTGWNYVMYVGPDDPITREWCADRVNKVYTLDEAKALKNENGQSAWNWGGGYNCRHSFVSIPDDVAKAAQRGD